MAIKLNLLPEELAVNKKLTSTVKALKNLSLISVILLILFSLGVLGYFLVSSTQLRNLEADISELSARIETQETVEQRIVLIRDRVIKIKAIETIDSAGDNFSEVLPVVDSLPADASLNELSIDSQKIDASMTFRSSSSLSQFFSNLTSFENFSKITLSSFGLNPATGYVVGLRFITK